MKLKTVAFIIFCIGLITSCSQEKVKQLITIENTLNIDRSFETVELSKDFLKVEDLTTIGIRDVSSNKIQVSQLVDIDGDGVVDQLLFQPKIAANSKKKFEVVTISNEDKPVFEERCYARFVPERTDDFAWENNKVAFRVYGPTAQKMIEDGVKGGTLSSGVDAWLKRVEYPIINKWYKKHSDKTGTYHEDTGEGLDNFHVGVSRGVGGIAVKKDSSYYFSKNYTDWKVISTGPIRTSFYLNYEDWDANGNIIKESRVISLDYGSNLSKFEISIEGTNRVAAGLTLHEKDGEVTGSRKNGWVSYWQPHADSELGTTILASKEYFIDFEKYVTSKKDLSNAYTNLNVINNKVIYYAGFGWKKSKQINNKKEWENYLNEFSLKVNTPLIIKQY
ncbi:protein of unknown function [Lutibacter oricola]|uniref:DUF4861 domain-containing protein n=1 Tax=Lutibacter oricola TaxID=762486 RepID=A0A1H3D800_9FLAO|nr:DUF4861 family protein [Lutibacter oricola]SDX61809.1 protein of unknown function [Lutibacter oricola]